MTQSKSQNSGKNTYLPANQYRCGKLGWPMMTFNKRRPDPGRCTRASAWSNLPTAELIINKKNGWVTKHDRTVDKTLDFPRTKPIFFAASPNKGVDLSWTPKIWSRKKDRYCLASAHGRDPVEFCKDHCVSLRSLLSIYSNSSLDRLFRQCLQMSFQHFWHWQLQSNNALTSAIELPKDMAAKKRNASNMQQPFTGPAASNRINIMNALVATDWLLDFVGQAWFGAILDPFVYWSSNFVERSNPWRFPGLPHCCQGHTVPAGFHPDKELGKGYVKYSLNQNPALVLDLFTVAVLTIGDLNVLNIRRHGSIINYHPQLP